MVLQVVSNEFAIDFGSIINIVKIINTASAAFTPPPSFSPAVPETAVVSSGN